MRQKRNYDVHAKDQSQYSIGALVRYYYVPLKNKHKFACPWVGPYTVLARVTDVDYRIQRFSRPQDTRVVHVDHLKPFEKDYEPNLDNLDLPPLILDEDYLDLVDQKAHNEYLDFLEPLLDQRSASPVSTESEVEPSSNSPVEGPVLPRPSTRHKKAPRRYGHASHPVHLESVFWL